jgi:hypothetical protein
MTTSRGDGDDVEDLLLVGDTRKGLINVAGRSYFIIVVGAEVSVMERGLKLMASAESRR